MDRKFWTYRWNPVKNKWEYWSFSDDCWMGSLNFRHSDSSIILPNYIIELSYIDTWCEPEYES